MRTPDDRDVLRLLLDVYHAERSYAPYCLTCQRLLKQRPNDPHLMAMLAGGYLNDYRPASALLAFRRFVRLWSNHPFVDPMRDTIRRLEVAVAELVRETPFPKEEAVALAAMHDEVLASVSAGDDARAIEVGEELLARCPQFIPARNNVNHAYFGLGLHDRAIAGTRQVLETEPENLHATADLARYLLLSGQLSAADAARQRLISLPSEKPERWTKKSESLSLFGDDDAVLQMYEGAVRAGYTQGTTPGVALLLHLAAVAHARLGDDRSARRLLEAGPADQVGLWLGARKPGRCETPGERDVRGLGPFRSSAGSAGL